MSPLDPEQRRRRSRRALVRRFPELAPVLEADYGLRPVLEAGEVVDLSAADGRLYGHDGRRRALDQAAGWLAQPQRLVPPRPEPGLERESALKTRLIEFLTAECRRLGLDPAALPAAPVLDESLLVVLGIGLGHHLPALVEGGGGREVVLVESAPALLAGSLAALDWHDLLERGEAAGRRFHLILDDRADAILQRLGQIFLAGGGARLDGAGVFLHYPAPALAETRARLNEIAQLVFMSRGYFEDEMVMLANSLANLRRGGFALVDAGRRPSRPEPVLVVGSGPSIDGSIEAVRRLRAQALVVSCGSALRVCLAHGIVPDFHCEIENGAWVLEAIGLAAAGRDLAPVTLIAPTTVDPRVPALFGRSLLFFREETAPTRILAPPGHEVFLAVPTVANTALRLMAGLGFERFHLFGIDCGTKSADKRHSVATVYHDQPEFRAFEEAMKLVHPCPGNFGGTVQADWTFTFSRLFLEKLIESFGLEVFNCSDGARIAHTRPLPAARLRLGGGAPVRGAALCAGLPVAPPQPARPGLAPEVGRLGAALRAAIEAGRREDADGIAFQARLAGFFERHRDDFGRVSVLFEGSALAWSKIGLWFLHRIADPGARGALFRAFLDEYQRLAEEMIAMAMERLEQEEAVGSSVQAARAADRASATRPTAESERAG
jgi:hypothetical protein